MNAVELSQNQIESNTENVAPPLVYRPARTTKGHSQEQPFLLEEAERGITLHVGEQFSLNLGKRDWKMRIEDEVRLQLVTEVAEANAGVWTFEAKDCGKTCLYASSDAPPGDESSNHLRTLLVTIPVTILP